MDELVVNLAQLDQKLTDGLSEVCENWDTSQNQQEKVIFAWKTRPLKKILAHFKATISNYAEI